jgi:hypothetical protein
MADQCLVIKTAANIRREIISLKSGNNAIKDDNIERVSFHSLE